MKECMLAKSWSVSCKMPRPLSLFIPAHDSSQVKQLRDAYERMERSSTPTPRCNCVCVGADFDNCLMPFQQQNAKHAVQGHDDSGVGAVEFVAPCSLRRPASSDQGRPKEQQTIQVFQVSECSGFPLPSSESVSLQFGCVR